MRTEMAITPGKKIPIFKIIYYDDRETCVQFKNSHTHNFEEMSASDFIVWIIKKLYANAES